MPAIRQLLAMTATTLLALGCASPSKTPESKPTYEERLDALLRLRPDDPDLLFLRLDFRGHGHWVKLASLRPTPMILAHLANEYIAGGLDEKTLPEFKTLLQAWMNGDPENSMPWILRGLLETSLGDLRGGLETLVRASGLKHLRTYALEAQQEALRIQNQEGLTEIEYLGVYFTLNNLSLAMAVSRACNLLETASIENHRRENREETQRLAEADYRIALSFSASAKSFLEASLAHQGTSHASDRLCELHLMAGDVALASRYATQSRRSHLARSASELAQKHDGVNSPINQIMREAGLRKELDVAIVSEVMASLLADGSEDLWGRYLAKMRELEDKEAWPRFYAKLRENEGRVRAYLESQVQRGQAAVVLESLTEEDRRSIQSVKFPIDHFMDARGIFYPERYGAEHRERLIEYLSGGPQEGDSELWDYLWEKAAHALVHHGDKDALPKLRSLLDQKEKKSSEFGIAVVMVGLGDRSERVIKILEEDFEAYLPGACWALARLGRKAVVPDLVEALVLDVLQGRITSGYREAVPAYFALRDLTGQDFGLDEDKWSEWAERTGNQKK